MKKYLPYIIITVAVGFLAYFGFFKEERAQLVRDRSATASDDPARWDTKTDNQANVTIAITPLEVSEQSQEWRFNISMDTHSVTLDQDMTRTAVLIDDQGRTYGPTRWEGSTGGHHREGVLVFSRISPLPQSIELEIADVGGVTRDFTWQLK